MKKSGRYDTSGLVEDQYEPGSHGQVLKNLLGFKSRQEIEKVETDELMRVTDELAETYDRDHRFTAKDICAIHKNWLGRIYEWAGRYRQVTISKGGFTFAVPEFIPELVDKFEKNILVRYTPCTFTERDEIITALTVVHVELLLIHPFRDGNGRISRLLATLMALQAGLPFLDFGDIEGQKKEYYFEAVSSGLENNYKPMEKLFNDVICRSLQVFDEK